MQQSMCSGPGSLPLAESCAAVLGVLQLINNLEVQLQQFSLQQPGQRSPPALAQAISEAQALHHDMLSAACVHLPLKRFKQMMEVCEVVVGQQASAIQERAQQCDSSCILSCLLEAFRGYHAPPAVPSSGREQPEGCPPHLTEEAQRNATVQRRVAARLLLGSRPLERLLLTSAVHASTGATATRMDLLCSLAALVQLLRMAVGAAAAGEGGPGPASTALPGSVDLPSLMSALSYQLSCFSEVSGCLTLCDSLGQVCQMLCCMWQAIMKCGYSTANELAAGKGSGWVRRAQGLFPHPCHCGRRSLMPHTCFGVPRYHCAKISLPRYRCTAARWRVSTQSTRGLVQESLESGPAQELLLQIAELWSTLAQLGLTRSLTAETVSAMCTVLLRMACLLPRQQVGLRWRLLGAVAANACCREACMSMLPHLGADAAGIKGRLLELVSELQLDEGLDELVGCSGAGWAHAALLPYEWRQQALVMAMSVLQLVFGRGLVVADAQATHLPYLLRAGLAPAGSTAVEAPNSAGNGSSSGAAAGASASTSTSDSHHGWLLERSSSSSSSSSRPFLVIRDQAGQLLKTITFNTCNRHNSAHSMLQQQRTMQQRAEQLWNLMEQSIATTLRSDGPGNAFPAAVVCSALQQLYQASSAILVRCLNSGLLAAALCIIAKGEEYNLAIQKADCMHCWHQLPAPKLRLETFTARADGTTAWCNRACGAPHPSALISWTLRCSSFLNLLTRLACR
jgi:hypothetical protein